MLLANLKYSKKMMSRIWGWVRYKSRIYIVHLRFITDPVPTLGSHAGKMVLKKKTSHAHYCTYVYPKKYTPNFIPTKNMDSSPPAKRQALGDISNRSPASHDFEKDMYPIIPINDYDLPVREPLIPQNFHPLLPLYKHDLETGELSHDALSKIFCSRRHISWRFETFDAKHSLVSMAFCSSS